MLGRRDTLRERRATLVAVERMMIRGGRGRGLMGMRMEVVGRGVWG